MPELPDLALLALLVVAGVAGGFVNTLAGGGAVIQVPALMLAGLPADLANASSRVAVLAQSATGAVGWSRAGRVDRSAVVDVVPLTVAGAIAGAYVATIVPARVFEPILIGTILVVTLLLFARPEVLAPPPGTEPRRVRSQPLAWLALLGAGFYGGLLQAGVGIVLIAMFGGFLRYELGRANALKVLVVLVYTAAALVVFVARGKVVWAPALALATGNVAGAHLAVKISLRAGDRMVRAVIVLAALGIITAVLLR